MNDSGRPMSEQTAFIRQQYAFAAAIRDPEHFPLPADVDERRMSVYQELFFNNAQDFLANSFPVLREIYSEQNWLSLVRDYFATHRAHSPLFLQIPAEFLQYLREERQAQDDDPGFLYELAHYEWVELALSIDTRDITDVEHDEKSELMDAVPVLSPLAWPLMYHYPVHQIGPDFQPQQPGQEPSWLIVYRNRDDEVKFMTLNPVTARLVELLSQAQGLTGRKVLQQIAAELQHPQPQVVIDGGEAILNDLQSRDIILGTVPG